MRISVQDWCNDVGITYKDLKVVARKNTRFNSIILAESPTVGHILIINGEVQHVEAWEFLYHETVVHLPMSFIPRPTNALILGGGSLNALRETLKYKSLKGVTLAERDSGVIEIMIRKNPHLESLIREKRVKCIEGDAIEFLTNTTEKYDLIVNDALDLTRVRVGGNVAQILKERLTPEGIFSDIVYRHLLEKETTLLTLLLLGRKPHRAFSLVFVPEYPGFLHLLTLWGNNKRLSQSFDHSINEDQLRWIASGKVPCKYYDPKCVVYYLYLPRYVKSFLQHGQKNIRLKLRSREGHSMSS